jgi:release factor glutamine methyltransferase
VTANEDTQTGTLGHALVAATRRLKRAGTPESKLEAEFLMAKAMETDRGGVLARRDDPLPDDLATLYEAWVSRREKREPFQHITGVQEFYGLEFRVDRRVLVPRPETEGIVDAILGLDLPNHARVADLGTGSGCIAITLAVKRRDFELYALDASADALEVARDNAFRHEVDDRIEFRQGDFKLVPEQWRERLDAVVSNPPYVSAEDWQGLAPEVRDYDPREALVPGPSGLEAYGPLLETAFELLRPEGSIVLELGWGQADRVRELVSEAGFRGVQVRPDLRSIPRVLIAEKR